MEGLRVSPAIWESTPLRRFAVSPYKAQLTLHSFPNKTMWITEYNLNNQDLVSTQTFYNTSAEYFDRLDFVERYSLFGAFRSHVSNVGPNAAMLNRDGQLTDIGAWYLGRQGTGVRPTSGGLAVLPSMMALVGCMVATAVLLGF